MSLLRLDRLAKAYGPVEVLRSVDLTVTTGETAAIVGPSGCGKTTLLRLVAGLDLPDQGAIYLDGKQVSRPGWALAPHERNLGFLFQEPALWPHMTALENVLFGLQRLGRSEALRRARTLLVGMGLEGLADRYPDQLSVGQARRVALARALAPEPKYLLLDEPLTSLDPALKEELIVLLRQELSQAVVLLVTHDLEEAATLAQAIYRLDGGCLVEQRRPCSQR